MDGIFASCSLAGRISRTINFLVSPGTEFVPGVRAILRGENNTRVLESGVSGVSVHNISIFLHYNIK
jgi:hypothetical protein